MTLSAFAVRMLGNTAVWLPTRWWILAEDGRRTRALLTCEGGSRSHAGGVDAAEALRVGRDAGSVQRQVGPSWTFCRGSIRRESEPYIATASCSRPWRTSKHRSAPVRLWQQVVVTQQTAVDEKGRSEVCNHSLSGSDHQLRQSGPWHVRRIPDHNLSHNRDRSCAGACFEHQRQPISCMNRNYVIHARHALVEQEYAYGALRVSHRI